MKYLFPFYALLDLIAPPRCVGCQKTFSPSSGLKIAFCSLCAEMCLEAPFLSNTHSAQAPLFYGGKLAEAIHQMKYQKDDMVASVLGKLLAELVPSSYTPCQYIVPIPLGAKRLRERGFDQAALFARILAKRWKKKCLANLLRRIRETPPLSRMVIGERKEAIQGVFSASPKTKNLSILLVDDVYTTGATTEEARKTLLQAGASRVDILCLAKTPKYSDEL